MTKGVVMRVFGRRTQHTGGPISELTEGVLKVNNDGGGRFGLFYTPLVSPPLLSSAARLQTSHAFNNGRDRVNLLSVKLRE
jgi:hypothetical protein